MINWIKISINKNYAYKNIIKDYNYYVLINWLNINGINK